MKKGFIFATELRVRKIHVIRVRGDIPYVAVKSLLGL